MLAGKPQANHTDSIHRAMHGERVLSTLFLRCTCPRDVQSLFQASKVHQAKGHPAWTQEFELEAFLVVGLLVHAAQTNKVC